MEEFVPGQFQQFRATTKVHLGSINQDIVKGSVVEYDGSNVKIGGQTHNIPSIAGAIKLGWLVPIADNISQYIPKPAGVQVRPSTSAHQERGQAMTIEAAQDDEHEVGTLAGSNAKRAAALEEQNPAVQQSTPRPQARVEVAEPAKRKYEVVHDEMPTEYEFRGSKEGSQVGPPKKQGKQEPIVADDSHEQGGRPVARLSSATKKTVIIKDSVDSVAREIQNLDSQKGGGLKVIKVAALSRANEDAEGGTPINQNHRSGATGDVNETITGDDLADLLPDAVSPSKPRAGLVKEDAHGVARIAWDKSDHWRVRAKRAMDEYGNDPNALRQIIEVEDPGVVSHIRASLAKK